ncbi:hypothetical protein MNEG_5654 [Monoraphidium neglectum]|uniref:LTD domain-containing protein n=1 Tax=Monoraphidium neglectum TaxID=145388 RepID=A0A0D2L5K8_9CHLO|nr:hypothetical protein MNEG_5654 [Monoraphidium neglectum]KIZ02309.1 hypothetical protein MNEG_5654 [Monoraphidium neglectum]|eukprot:XP_013901328.1 hypothetical protein MNEG_5654 [Monoraphidium neglectum]
MPNYWGKANRKNNPEDWQLLANLAKGLAGGGLVPRSRFIFDALDLPSVINEMALETLLGNMDRCTKNYYLWYNPKAQTWTRIPWDLEASMGQDNGLGGAPGNLYCLLACEQWSSPLYCDSEHPQDLEVRTPWGATTVVGLNSYFGPGRGAAGGSTAQTGRRLLQGGAAGGKLLAEGNQQLSFPAPRGWDDPDRVTFGTPSPNGAPGSYNHLTDAVLDVNATRAMYLRRLRTLADKFYGPEPDKGRLRQIIDETWARIKDAAARDNAKWARGDGTRGAKQLLQTYAPGGQRPLLPGPQDSSKAKISVTKVETSGPAGEHYIQIANGSPDEAVDASGWTLSSGDASWALPPGTILPGGASAFLTWDPPAFKARKASPKGGEGLLVVQAPAQMMALAGPGQWSVKDAAGAEVSKASL